MLHITCDLCGKEVCPSAEPHYVVRIEAFAAHDPAELTEDDFDEDNLQAISQILEGMEDNPNASPLAKPCRKFRYDLCADCQEKFVNDPLGRAHLEKLNFSKN